MKNLRFDNNMRALADVLVNHSIKSQMPDETIKGKKILVTGEVSTKPLMLALEERIIKQEGHSILRPHFETTLRGHNVATGFSHLLSKDQASFVPKAYTDLFNEVDGFIYIIGSENQDLATRDSKTLTTVRKANKKLLDIRCSKPWVLTLYPTNEGAKFEGFSSRKEYKDFILNSCLVDYKMMLESQKEIKQLIDNSKDVILRTYDPRKNKILELTFSKGTNIADMCAGFCNVPDGEIYTSLYANTTQGEIFLDIPIYHDGHTLSGVYLKFRDGCIVDFSAQSGQGLLEEIITTDLDSNKLGEFALGTNYEIQRAFKETLFAEKIGGSIHLAIGDSYQEPYPQLYKDGVVKYKDGLIDSKSKLKGKELEREKAKLVKQGIYSNSAQHVDIPKDFRNPKPGEEIIIGGKNLYWKNNKWNIEN